MTHNTKKIAALTLNTCQPTGLTYGEARGIETWRELEAREASVRGSMAHFWDSMIYGIIGGDNRCCDLSSEEILAFFKTHQEFYAEETGLRVAYSGEMITVASFWLALERHDARMAEYDAAFFRGERDECLLFSCETL